ncbi:MAG: rRNA cytosine-C5-methyltransferase, partial [Porphyromonadaceae bacterium]|nr:rRNA cytosine-C5-methyltransferase [Porphyromonadaceae bacterium]
FPHRTRGEGLFMMALRKPGNPEEREIGWLGRNAARSKGKKERKASSKETFPFPTWLTAPDCYTFTVGENGATALPVAWAGEMTRLADRLNVVCQGLPIAFRKGADWQPHPALALSTALRSDAFETLPLNLDEAIAYLRRETLPVPPDNHRGIRLVTYEGHPLGWCNHVGNRINNLYPSEWRIRSGYRPETLNLPL